MNNRLKQLREIINLSQNEFAEQIGIARSTLSLLEKGERILQDRHIKLICQTFNVNEEWLRNGIEPIFKEKDTELIKEVVKEYSLDETDELILTNFLNLNSAERKEVISTARRLVELLTNPQNKNSNDGSIILKNGQEAKLGTTFEKDLAKENEINDKIKNCN